MITGACGFTGRHLVRRLRQESGLRIVGLDMHSLCAGGLDVDEYVSVDLRDRKALSLIVERVQPDLVFHLVGKMRGLAAEIYEINTMCAVNMLEVICERAPRAAVLVVGSAAEYGYQSSSVMPIRENCVCQPVGPYGLSKYAQTMAALDYAAVRGVKVVVARPFNIIGPGVPSNLVGGALLQRIKDVLREGTSLEIPVGNLDSERDFVGVDDVVDAYVKMLKNECWGEVYNICSGKPVSIKRIAELLLEKVDTPLSLKQDPALIRKSEAKIIYGSWQKAHEAFGFMPSQDISDVLAESLSYELESH